MNLKGLLAGKKSGFRWVPDIVDMLSSPPWSVQHAFIFLMYGRPYKGFHHGNHKTRAAVAGYKRIAPIATIIISGSGFLIKVNISSSEAGIMTAGCIY